MRLKSIVSLTIALSLATSVSFAAGHKGNSAPKGKTITSNVIDSNSSKTVDFNEETHLVFMRSEEKLARDVYTTLSMIYPESVVFGKIDDSEQRHTDAVKDKLDQYDIVDPNTNDNIGVFTGEEFGEHFTEEYQALVARAEVSELEALYVGAFIEELDMRDINQCPDEIISQDNGIDDVLSCGKVYTDNADIKQLYTSLLDGSDSHLKAYVNNIEKFIGEGNYESQVLSQKEVNKILQR